MARRVVLIKYEDGPAQHAWFLGVLDGLFGQPEDG